MVQAMVNATILSLEDRDTTSRQHFVRCIRYDMVFLQSQQPLSCTLTPYYPLLILELGSRQMHFCRRVESCRSVFMTVILPR